MMHEVVVTLRDGTATLRPARGADAEALVALDRTLALAGHGMVHSVDQVRSVAESRARIDQVYRAMRAGDATLALVAEIDGRICASAELRQLVQMRCRHVGILSVGVDPAVHRRGVARALMERLIEHAREYGLLRLELYVRADNAAAQALYHGVGFHHEATRARFVRLDDGTLVDDLIFARWIGA